MTSVCWNFIRARARDAMLAGIQDAFERVEQSDVDTDPFEQEPNSAEPARWEDLLEEAGASDKSSVWSSIRRRTRDAVLAGMRQALRETQSPVAA